MDVVWPQGRGTIWRVTNSLSQERLFTLRSKAETRPKIVMQVHLRLQCFSFTIHMVALHTLIHIHLIIVTF